jgi:N-acetylglucosamine malate deacetylase 1
VIAMPESAGFDILAIAAHRDDVEQTCGATLLKMAERGRRTAILDLTRGEMGTRGSVADRAREAEEAARILKVGWRRALDIPDGRVECTYDNRLKIAQVIRDLRPRVLILPYGRARHPDHAAASLLGYEGAFLAGLAKLGHTEATVDIQPDRLQAVCALPPHRPYKIIYASLYADVRPTFVVDISRQFEARLAALMAYRSQYQDQSAGSGLFPREAEIRERISAMASFYGLLAGVRYAEPFVQKEVGLVDDLLAIPVQSI